MFLFLNNLLYDLPKNFPFETLSIASKFENFKAAVFIYFNVKMCVRIIKGISNKVHKYTGFVKVTSTILTCALGLFS